MLQADIRLTPELESELKHLCEALSDDELTGLARSEPSLLVGGFRADKPAAVRMRLLQVAVGPQLISETVRRLLAAHSLNRPLVARLSRAALRDLRQELAALFGGPRLLLAMLLDERAEVREAAGRLLQSGPPFTAMNPEDAARVVREAFARLLEGVGATASANSGDLPRMREAWRDEKDRLSEQLRESRAENRRLKAVETRLARASEQLQASAAAGVEAGAQAEETARQLRQITRERDESRIELHREVTRREERLRAAVDAGLANEFAGWLAMARGLEAPAAAPADDVVARAEAALVRQAAADRHSGNRARLRTRLDQVEAVLARARDSLAAAMHPTPELRQAENDLEQEAGRLRDLLGIRAPVTPFEAALAAHFNGAHANDLPHLRTWVDRLAQIGALDKPALDRLDALLTRRQAITQATGDLPEGSEGSTAAGVLQRALAGRQPAILLVDGHNALFGLQGRYLAPQGSAVPDGNKRARLVADLVHRFKGRPTCRAWIVFDGPEASDSSPAPNVRVTYSGGQGANRADGVLLDNVRFLRAEDPAIPILLVSNDHALGAEARRLGAQTLTALELGAVL